MAEIDLKREYASKTGVGTVLIWEGGNKVVNDDGNVRTLTLVERPGSRLAALITHQDGSQRHIIVGSSCAVDVREFDGMLKA
jgi:hypothetical protein